MSFHYGIGIIGLALAFVIGQAASRLVTAFVNNIIDPFIGLFLPAGSLEAMTFKVTNLAGSTTEFKYGDLISNIFDFLIIALIVFLAYRQLSRYKLVEDRTKPVHQMKRNSENNILFNNTYFKRPQVTQPRTPDQCDLE